MRIIAVIPARYGSSRLPGKPLLEICGKPMICRVLERAKQATALDGVLVATDDERIKAAVEAAGGSVCMTSATCASGSDRLLEVARRVPADVYINIQGDEPLLDPAAIDLLARFMRQEDHPLVATLAHEVRAEDRERILDPNLVKVVCDASGRALYFSRAPIPYVRDPGTPASFLAHIGVYAYTRGALLSFGSLPPSPLEAIEKLEQLRFLQAGIPIFVLRTKAFGPGVDTADDLARVCAIYSGTGDPKAKAESRDPTTVFSRARLVITDVDGVLTDGKLVYGAEGESLKCFHAKDGLGVVLARARGIEVAVLSGRDSLALRKRMSDLGIRIFRLGRLDKGCALAEIFAESGCTAEEAVFLGDDVADIPAFRGCALGVAVHDAHPSARAAADFVLQANGGQGALRELLDHIPGPNPNATVL